LVQNTGKIIRKIREAKNISLSALARDIKVSKSLICQVEKGEILPSLSTLEKIAVSLEVPITDFFKLEDELTEKNYSNIVRRDKRVKLSIPDSATVYYLLTPNLHANLEFLIVEFPPCSDSTGRDTFRHEGEEYFLVLEGEFTLKVENETYILYEGDSGYFDSNKKHLFVNNTDKKARLLVAATRK
jgi:transcriptional regulator with XRE-family HTH domain